MIWRSLQLRCNSALITFYGIGGSGYEFFLKGARRAPFKKNSYLKSATPFLLYKKYALQSEDDFLDERGAQNIYIKSSSNGIRVVNRTLCDSEYYRSVDLWLRSTPCTRPNHRLLLTPGDYLNYVYVEKSC